MEYVLFPVVLVALICLLLASPLGWALCAFPVAGLMALRKWRRAGAAGLALLGLQGVYHGLRYLDHLLPELFNEPESVGGASKMGGLMILAFMALGFAWYLSMWGFFSSLAEAIRKRRKRRRQLAASAAMARVPVPAGPAMAPEAEVLPHLPEESQLLR